MRLTIEQAGIVRHVVIDAGHMSGTVVLHMEDEVTVCDVRDLGRGHLSFRLHDGSMHDVVVEAGVTPGDRLVHIGGTSVALTVNARAPRGSGRPDVGSGPLAVRAPMPGKIVRVAAQPGDLVEARQTLVVIEAMKMENALSASRAGTVRDVLVQEGASVEAGRLLVVLE